WFIFAPRRLRHAACVGLVLFQCLILLTGNYGFFNWLTLALCVLLWDDASWRAFGKGRKASSMKSVSDRSRWPAWLIVPLGLASFILSWVPTSRRLMERDWIPNWLDTAYQATEPLHLVNSYGLFAVMTTVRMEIQVEGSDDGIQWKSYEFRWKPGPLDRAPRFTGLHMPRLDWQMWFAALSPYQRNTWFHRFLLRLQEGSPKVLALLKTNPFPDAPPRYLRATISRYRFTDLRGKAETGHWWTQGVAEPYAPVLSTETP